MLLALLGEKEEEVEAAMEDMREVKEMYKAQINELLNRLTAPSPTSTSVGSSKVNPPTAAAVGTAATAPSPFQRVEPITPIDIASKKR